MSKQVYENELLRQFWDDSTQPPTYTEYDATGAQILSRPYNEEELAELNQNILDAVVDVPSTATTVTNLTTDLADMQTIIGMTNSALNADFAANPAKYLKLCARVDRRLVRAKLEELSG